MEIEILKEDNINNFSKVDKYINEYDYKDKLIFSTQYPGDKKLGYSQGEITGKKWGYFLYSVGTKGGFSGSPIILFDDLTVIGLNKGCLYDENKNKINLGIPLNIIIEIIYSIICIYKMTKVDLNKDIQIINNAYYDDKHDFIEKNKEIKNKVNIIYNDIKINNMKYKFEKEGIYNIYITEKEKISGMSWMF